MEAKAILRSARISAQKVRLVADQVRGLPVARALDLLKFSDKKAAVMIYQVVFSAASNAENNNAPSRRGVVCSGADYFLAAGAAGASAASALAGSLMASSSRSNTSTELAGILGLPCSP